MSSGIKVHQDSTELFESVKQNKKYKYAFFKIDFAAPGDKHKTIIPDYKEPPQEISSLDEDRNTWEEMKQKLVELKEPRYIVYDFRHVNPDNGQTVETVTFVFWSPDGATSVKNKMVYASSWGSAQQVFKGMNKYHQCNDAESLDFDAILAGSRRTI